jgi:hypothetical protein
MKGLLLAILIVDLPPTPYEPPTEPDGQVQCYEGYELSTTNECVRVELQSCILEQARACDWGCYMRQHKWKHKWRHHKHHRVDRCDRDHHRARKSISGVKEVIIRDDGVIIAESECERQ